MTMPTDLPTWNTDGTNRTEPTSGQKATGYPVAAAPSSSNLNWMLWVIYKWCLYVQGLAAEAITWTAAHIFLGDSATTLVSIHNTNTASGAGLTVTTGAAAPALVLGEGTSHDSLNAAGDIYTARNVNSDGNMSAGGILGGASVAVTGAVTGASAAIVGAVTAASVAVTGAITGASSAVTGAITGASLATTGVATASEFAAPIVAADHAVFLGTVARAPLNMTPRTPATFPTTGIKGDILFTEVGGVVYLWVCTVAGSPGSWMFKSIDNT
jgi:hypothetical protein